MAAGGYGGYDNATANQDWSGNYPASSEGYSSSWNAQQSSGPTHQQYQETPASQLASGDVAGWEQQATASQYSWASQSGQAAAVRAPTRPAAPRMASPRSAAPRFAEHPSPGFQQGAMRQQLPPQGAAEQGASYAKMALQQLVSKVSATNHPSASAQYEQYYEGESGDYGRQDPNAYNSTAYGSSAPGALRPRIPSGAYGPRLAMARPSGSPGSAGWPSTRAATPRMRPALNRQPVSDFGGGGSGADRPVAPGMRGAGPGIRGAGPGVRTAGPGIRGAGPGVRTTGPGFRAAGPGGSAGLSPRVTTMGSRGMPAARGAATTLRTAGAGPRGAQAPGAGGTSLGPRPFALMDLTVQQSNSRGPSAFESRLSKLAESSCDELGISKTKNSFGSQDGNKTDGKAEASAVNEEEEDDEDDDEDDDPNSCKICDIKFDKSQAYHVHIRSTSHHQKVEARKKAKKALTASSEIPSSTTASSAPTETKPAGGSETVKKGEHFCYVCNFLFSNAEMFNSHLTGMLHVQRLEEQKIAKPSAADEEEEDGDEDSQDSMMVTSFKKNDWQSVNERDLNPEDIGKPGSAQFLCEVCNISCTGNKSYEMHIVGAKHLKKLKKTKEIEDFEKKKKEGGGGCDSAMVEDLLKTKKKRKVVRVQEQLDQCSEPLIGLDYMTEFQVEDSSIEPRYICDLCQCKMDMRQIIPHVTGIKHRQKYFKYHSIREYNILWDIRRKSEKVRAATKFAEETEAREGRHKMRLKIQLKPFEADDDKAKDEEWLEVDDAHSRPKSSLPGLGGFNERSALYKDVSEYEEEDDGERDEGPVLDVDALRRINPPAPVGPNRGRGTNMYQPPPPTRFRPGAPTLRPPGPPPRGQRPFGPPPRSLFPPREVGPRLPPARGYPPERRRAPMAPTDPYYQQQRYPGYNNRYDHYYPTPSSSSSSSLESRAVINYDHQSLTKDGDDYAATASATESSEARHGSDHYGKRPAGYEEERRVSGGHESEHYGKRPAGYEEERRVSGGHESDHYGKRPAGYEEERRVSVERSRNPPADDGDSNIANLNIDLVKAAIAQCNIDTEADAEIALQISNSLTQALLEYRLNSLAKAGTSDAALENHLKNLRQQNAEHLTSGHHPETSNLMYSALRATRALASKLPSGDQDTIKQAMSVLDAVNLQLYGMLDKGGDSTNKSSEDSQRRQETAAVSQAEPPQMSREIRPDRSGRITGYEQRDEGQRESPEEYRQMGSVTTTRPPSKRFRFGL